MSPMGGGGVGDVAPWTLCGGFMDSLEWDGDGDVLAPWALWGGVGVWLYGPYRVGIRMWWIMG